MVENHPVHLKSRVQVEGEALVESAFALARALHDDPELSGEESRSAALLCTALRAEGFRVEMGVGGLPTSFVASKGGGGRPVVAFLAEYDALPGIGHGCGHNLIGAAAAGAGIALARCAADVEGEVRVIGTPAEETLGGKVIMAEAGLFSGVDAALMIHPGGEERVLTQSLACQSLEVVFRGRGAHAVAHPEKGINALDALLSLLAGRDALVRRSRRGVCIVGVITDGGVRPNIVPERAVGLFSLRATRRTHLEEVVREFRQLAVGVGAAHRCGVEVHETDRAYHEMVTSVTLADAYRANLAELGVGVNDAPRENMGSLDMGNVSYLVPSLHSFVAIVPPEVASHTLEFAQATMSAAGRDGLRRGLVALAMTGADVLTDTTLRRRAAAEHRQLVAERA